MLFMSRHNSRLLQELLKQCRDIKIHCHDIVLSFDFQYVATFISLLQHLSVNHSHTMSRQSFEMSQQYLNFQLEFNFVFVATYHCLLSTLLVALSFCCDIMRLCRDILRLCHDIFALANFLLLFLLDLFLLH